MRSLYLRIYLTVLAALALFALTSGWLVQRHLDQQRVLAESAMRDRSEAWGDLLERSLPPSDAPVEVQLAALREWSSRLRVPLALDDARGRRIGASESFLRRGGDARDQQGRVRQIQFDDGRKLSIMRWGGMRAGAGAGRGPPELRTPWLGPPGWPDWLGLTILLLMLFIAVALGAWPVVRRLTRRLESLKQGVEAFGAGALGQRVSEDGRDEVAAVGASFNRAATRIEALLRAHQSLLANASHELRSPLARLKMALTMIEDAGPAQRDALRREIQTDIAELDALVEEVLLASRLDATAVLDRSDQVELLGMVAEEAGRIGAQASGDDVRIGGNERLLRRAVRNLLENARRYGGSEVEAQVERWPRSVQVRVSDRGPGVPGDYRERIFEPFFRLPGHAERAGGVGLGLSLVRQIAERHGGTVRCEARAGGGSSFVLELPNT